MKKRLVNTLLFPLFAVIACNNIKSSEMEKENNPRKAIDYLKDNKASFQLFGELGDIFIPNIQKLINSNRLPEDLKKYREDYLFFWNCIPQDKRLPIFKDPKKFDDGVRADIALTKDNVSQDEWEIFSFLLNNASKMEDLENIIDDIIDSIRKRAKITPGLSRKKLKR